jgi:hypothetical protein
MTRAQLRLAILAWLHRSSLKTPVSSDFDATVGFIALCEQDLNERLRARCMVKRAHETVQGQYLTLPCDWLEPMDMRNAAGGPPLTFATRTEMASAFFNHTMNTPMGSSMAGMGPDFTPVPMAPAWAWDDGVPRRFTIIGNEVEFSPFPQPANPIPPGYGWPVVEMAYYERLNLGLEDDDTNNVLATYPGLYIYGALIHSAPFLRDDSRVDTWARQFEGLLAGANREHEKSRTGGMSPLRQTYRRLG